MPSQQFIAIETRRADGSAGRVFRSAKAVSTISQADAQQKAAAQAQTDATAAANGATRPPTEPYPYGVRDLIEPEIASVACNGVPIARITRNAYGASVLNATNVMFVDVDIAQNGKDPDTGRPAAPDAVKSQDEALALLTALVATRPDLAFRVYATAAGLRYLCTNKLFQPETLESEEILKSLKSDKRYVLLCRKQKCYRARLTPKPWRCNKKAAQPAPPQQTATSPAAPAPQGFATKLLYDILRNTSIYRKLETAGIPVTKMLFGITTPPTSTPPRMTTTTTPSGSPADFVTCRYLKTIGTPISTTPPEVSEIIRIHDEQCGVATEKPLA